MDEESEWEAEITKALDEKRGFRQTAGGDPIWECIRKYQFHKARLDQKRRLDEKYRFWRDTQKQLSALLDGIKNTPKRNSASIYYLSMRWTTTMRNLLDECVRRLRTQESLC